MSAVMNDPRLAFDAEAHRYDLAGRALPSVTQVLKAAGIAAFDSPWFTDAVRDRGSFVHQAIALDVEGALDDDTLDPVLAPYVEAFRRFRAESGAAIEHWERPVCDPALGYAGTLDGVIVLPQKGAARRTVIDVKSAVYPATGPQVAAYLRCARALYTEPVLFNRAALVLKADGSYQLHPLTDANDEQVFLAALRVFHFRAQHGLEAA